MYVNSESYVADAKNKVRIFLKSVYVISAITSGEVTQQRTKATNMLSHCKPSKNKYVF